MNKIVFLLIVISMFLGSCSKDRNGEKKNHSNRSSVSDKKNFDWYKFVSAHTSGEISRKGKIRVVFTKDISSDKSLADIIKIDPNIKGAISLNGKREIVFTPSVGLKPSTKYSVSVDVASIIDEAPNKKYKFDFSVVPRTVSFKFDGFIYGANSSRDVILEGALNTNDIEDNNKVEEILSVYQKDTKKRIEWKHSKDGLQHKFIVKGIMRKKWETFVNVKCDAQAVGIDFKLQKKLKVAAIGDYQVYKIDAFNKKSQSIDVWFSENLSPKQDLNGLVKVLGYKNLRFVKKNSLLRIYSDEKFIGNINVYISKLVKNAQHKYMRNDFRGRVVFNVEKPAVKFLGKGVIVPTGEKITVPFEAVGVKSVQVTVFQIYENNMGQFLQENNLDGKSSLYRVGRYIFRKTVKLSDDYEILNKKTRYSLDVSDLVNANPGSMFKFTLSINRGNTVYSDDHVIKEPPFRNRDDLNYVENSGWDGISDWFSSSNNNDRWRNRKNPAKDEYYNPDYNSSVKSSKNFITSNIGIVAKKGDDNILKIATTDLLNASELGNVKVIVYNFQNQKIGEKITDGNGFCNIKIKTVPFYLLAKQNKSVGYLKLNRSSSLPMSHFEIKGERNTKGVKGEIYGERGVWRPGDSLFLTFVLRDISHTLPKNHPVIMELINPRGQIVKTLKPVSRLNSFYSFRVATNESAPTGLWTARVRIGGIVFSKKLKVETIVPNRLKIKFITDKALYKFENMDVGADIESEWLHGAPASNLKAMVNLSYSKQRTEFKKFSDYIFEDPTVRFRGGKYLIYNGTLNEFGDARFKFPLKLNNRAPGMLRANFSTKVFEPSGAFSIDRFSVPFYPYKSYVGIKMPKGDAARGILLTDTTHTVDIRVLSAFGKMAKTKKLDVYLYKINWKWWWDKTDDNLSRYQSANSRNIIKKAVVKVRNGKAQFKFRVNYPSWGRYLIRVVDKESGHSTGTVFYMDWPGWAGRSMQGKGVGATMLNFSTDKKKYIVGDSATIFLPVTYNSRALISFESGNKVIKQIWQDAKKGKNRIRFKVTKNMTPNIYINITLLQPHKDRKNDAPMRLYGVIPITVENPETKLRPVINCENKFEPETIATIKVSEKDSKAMTYTLAVVDEGLLGLTRYQTPDLRSEFYKKEALLVKTWDMFDYVVGAYGAKLERVLGIGGGASADNVKTTKMKRFSPVAIYMGPFYLKKGEKRSHKVHIPQYMGAVRVMVVAGDEDAYGYDEKSVVVKKDIMLLPTLPRVMRPNEEYDVPVTLFANSNKIKKFDVSIKTDGGLFVEGKKSLGVKFESIGEKTVLFRVRTGNEIGKAKITFKASKSFSTLAENSVYIDVLAANGYESRPINVVIPANGSKDVTIAPFGIVKSNTIDLELLATPNIDIKKYLDYLISYPHGCVEQTTSKAFPQIYLKYLVNLSNKDFNKIEYNVESAFEKLAGFQTYSGGFSYWPGRSNVNQWASNYVIEFLLEAKKIGYHVPENMLNNGISYIKKAANTWNGRSTPAVQAYRLYLLSSVGKPDFGAMNRLKENRNMNSLSKLYLSAAFYKVGQKSVSNSILESIDLNFRNSGRSGMFSSRLRDMSIALILFNEMNKQEETRILKNKVLDALARRSRLNTQDAAYTLMAISKFYLDAKNIVIPFKAGVNGKLKKHRMSKPIYKEKLFKFKDNKNAIVTIKNKSDKSIYATITLKGIPNAGDEQVKNKGIYTKEIFTYKDPNKIFSNGDYIKAGTEMLSSVTLKNTSGKNLENIALTQIFPAGFEIEDAKYDLSPIDYQDVRDDRVFTYFSLKRGETKSFTVLLSATYRGKFYKPGVFVEAMYNREIYSSGRGFWVEVKK